MVLPGITVPWWDRVLEKLKLVEVEHNEVTSTEDGHENTQTAEEKRVEGATERPPGAQAQKGEEIDSGGQGGQHYT